MKANKILPFSEAINAIGRPVTYYPSIANALGCVKTGIFISNFMYWEGLQLDAEGYIYKTQDEIHKETGLSRYEQESARRKLKKLNILFEKRQGIPSKLYYRFDWAVLDTELQHFIRNGNKEIKKKLDVPATLIQTMRELFDTKFVEESRGVEFDWANGKEWGNLKRIEASLRKKIKETNVKSGKTGDDINVKDDEVIASWKMFLELLPEYHCTRNLTPTLLYSNWNKIVIDIKSENATNNKKQQKPNTKSNAKAYI